MRRGSSAAAVDDRVVVGGAVLGDVDGRQVRVVGVQPHEELGESGRSDRPAHVGVDLGRPGFRDTLDGRIDRDAIGSLARARCPG